MTGSCSPLTALLTLPLPSLQLLDISALGLSSQLCFCLSVLTQSPPLLLQSCASHFPPHTQSSVEVPQLSLAAVLTALVTQLLFAHRCFYTTWQFCGTHLFPISLLEPACG